MTLPEIFYASKRKQHADNYFSSKVADWNYFTKEDIIFQNEFTLEYS